MSCCGGLRTATTTSPRTSIRRPVAPVPARANGTGVHYLGTKPILLRGPVSGTAYSFSPARAASAVDPRDVDVLLRTGLFRRT